MEGKNTHFVSICSKLKKHYCPKLEYSIIALSPTLNTYSIRWSVYGVGVRKVNKT